MRFVFCCEASAEIGLGHAVRCLAVADELRDLDAEVVFVTASAGSLVESRGYRVVPHPEGDAVVLDLRNGFSRAQTERLRERGMLVAVIDDASDRRLATDLAFYPPTARALALDWAGSTAKRHVGWEWVALRRGFARRTARERNGRPTVLVTMGGSDPANLTSLAIRALDRLLDEFRPVLVVGPAFRRRDELAAQLGASHRGFAIEEDVEDMPAVMASADLAVASFGMTAYELAAVGVPAVYLCLSDDHASSAEAFVAEGMAVSLGHHVTVRPEQVAGQVSALLEDEPRRRRMATVARRLVDGRGARRIARRMLDELDGGRATFARTETTDGGETIP